MSPPSLDDRDESSAGSGDDVTLAGTAGFGRASPRTVPGSQGDPGLDEGEFGRYEVRGTLGRGGMGTVLEARDTALDRKVALKVLHRGVGERQAARLMREAQAMAALSHPNVVQVYEVGAVDGRTFIAMELIDGWTLERWQEREPRPSWRARLDAYLDAGEGLTAAHAQGLIHRDFKPGNVMIGRDGRVRVLDFGLARRGDDSSAGTERPSPVEGFEPSSLDDPLTQTGSMLGTPAYMPLEQMHGLPLDGRSDQFAFCVALYEALYGQHPFESDSIAELMAAVTHGSFREPPSGTEVPDAVFLPIARGLATYADDRWPSMSTLLQQLRRAADPRRRRWLVPAVVVSGAVAVAVVVGVGSSGRDVAGCDGAAELQEVWDDERRATVKAAILGTELPYAADTWKRVEQRFDEHARAWVEQRDRLCEVTRGQAEAAPPDVDLRMRCLRRSRVALREAVAVLDGGDPAAVGEAIAVASSLQEPSRCEDVESLRAGVPAPEDPRVAEEVDSLRELLAGARVLVEALDVEGARSASEAAIVRARSLGYAPVIAEASNVRASALVLEARYEEAERAAEEAQLLAAEHGHEAAELEAVSQLTSIVGSRLARFEEGLRWGKSGLALVRRSGSHPAVEAQLLADLGTIHRKQRDLDRALEHHRQALAIRENTLPPGHPSIARSLADVGIVLDLQGRGQDALEHQRRALAIFEEALGPRHPRVGGVLGNMSLVQQSLGQLDDALATQQRSLAIQQAALGDEHRDVATALSNLGVTLSLMGRVEESLEHHRRSLAIKEQTLGPKHPDLAGALVNVGIAFKDLGRFEEALEHHQRALAIFEDAVGPEHPKAAMARANIGIVLVNQGQYGPALEQMERARKIWEAALGPRHLLVAQASEGVAGILAAMERPEEALEHYARAVEIREEAGPDDPMIAEVRAKMAELEPR